MITLHQKRVLSALLALERAHDCDWWSREAIGRVVGAGGYHQVIQMSTIDRLRDAGLVKREADSWTEETRQLVRCNCGYHHFGLTDAGREAAEELLIKVTPEGQKWLEYAKIDAIHCGNRARDRDNDEGEDEPCEWQ